MGRQPVATDRPTFASPAIRYRFRVPGYAGPDAIAIERRRSNRWRFLISTPWLEVDGPVPSRTLCQARPSGGTDAGARKPFVV